MLDLISIFWPVAIGLFVVLLIAVFIIKSIAEATSIALKTRSLIHKRKLNATVKSKARELITFSYFGIFLGFSGVFLIVSRNLPPAAGIICFFFGLFIFYQATIGANRTVNGQQAKRPTIKKGVWYIPKLD